MVHVGFHMLVQKLSVVINLIINGNMSLNFLPIGHYRLLNIKTIDKFQYELDAMIINFLSLKHFSMKLKLLLLYISDDMCYVSQLV